MSKLCKFNVKTALSAALAPFLFILTIYAHPANLPMLDVAFPKADTITPKNVVPVRKPPAASTPADTLKPKDSLVVKVDTIRMSKDTMDAVVRSQAEDSSVIIAGTKEMILYGKAKTDYKDMNIEAATIQFSQKTQLIKAYGATDSTGNIGSKPQFTQGDMKTVSDSIVYNFGTRKGLTQNTFLQQGEIFVNAKYIKNVDSVTAFARDARFTTCNLDTPHYAFRARRMKIINNKLAVTGRVYPEIEQVPIPMVFLPFGIFPLNRERHSGVLLPAFTSSEDFGLGLEGLGYYKVFGDHWDATTRANLYSYGGWSLNVASKYIERYKYSGTINVTFQSTRLLNRSASSEDEFTGSKSYMINWSHTRDTRARPGTSFSANVNFGSTRFNQYVLNNPYVNFQNQLSSSISYTKDFNGKFNISVNMNHNQNSITRLVNMNLPTLNLNVITLYPFQKKDQVGTGKWYEKIGIGYSGNFQNQFSFYDTAFSTRRLLDTLQYGATHSVPITISLPSVGPFTLSPGITYEERWYGQRNFKRWDSVNQRVDTTTQRGFYTARQMSFSLGVNTRIFGTYTFGENSNVVAIRHEVRPSFSISYHPDFQSRYYYNTRVDTAGHVVRFSQFDGGIIGPFSEGTFGGINFGIDNVLEMKVKDKHNLDTSATSKTKYKKIKLLDGFGFNSSYNFLADSFQLGYFSLYARSTLFEKVNITASAQIDPYNTDNFGYRQNKLLFDPLRLKFGRITGGNVAVSTAFSSKSKDGKTDQNRQLPVDPFMTPDEQQRQLQYARANPAEFTDFNIPWTLSLSYSLNFTRVLKPDFTGFQTDVYSSVNFNGDFSLTPKWKVGATGYYDFKTGALTQLSSYISREMHCWQLSINVTPIGLYRSFNITFSPKSGILRDLKINRTRTFISY